MTRWEVAALVGIAAAALAAGGCGAENDSDEPAAQPTTTASADSTPTVSVEAMNDRFGEKLHVLGVELTRAGTTKRLGEEGYVDGGKHLALYVRAIDPSEPVDVYIDRIVPLARVFLPEVFSAMPNIDTMDVCQEAPASGDSYDDEPATYSAMVVTRDQSDAIDWPDFTLEAAVSASLSQPQRLQLGVGGPVAGSPKWQSLVRDAERSKPAPTG